MKLLTAILSIFFAPALGMPGGWSTISETDENVVNAADVSITLHSIKLRHCMKYRLTSMNVIPILL